MSSFEFAARNVRVIKALMLRETITRFGREGLGFLWLIGEPLMFCIGVLVMWSLLKPEYEHGVRLGPFVMTGYMCLLLLRHQSAYSLGALQGNIGLLYHRQINVLSVYITRNLLEFLGSTAAFVVVYVVLIILGQVTPPKDWGLLLSGWMIMCWISTGVCPVVGGSFAQVRSYGAACAANSVYAYTNLRRIFYGRVDS